MSFAVSDGVSSRETKGAVYKLTRKAKTSGTIDP